jgi:hypothetical protein
MKCFLCGKTEDDVAKTSLKVAKSINKALETAVTDKERDILLGQKKELNRISFTIIEIPKKTCTAFEKCMDIEQSNSEPMICMHCKSKIGDWKNFTRMFIFYDYVSLFIVAAKGYGVNNCCTYKNIAVDKKVIFELKNDKVIVGYKGIVGIEKELSQILNHRLFNCYYSRLIINTTEDKIYKYYLLKHDVTDKIKNMIEAIYIQNSLSLLEIEYKKLE